MGCGCRGRALGESLLEVGWQVRGTARERARAGAIADAGIEPAIADPARVGTLYEQLHGVTLVYWLLGSARGAPSAVAALHGPRLERFLEKLVDTPVRGFVYEAGGSLAPKLAERGGRLVAEAGARWRIPVEVVSARTAEWTAWREEMLAAADRLTGSA